ncbi:MAG TPA: hypothetical protein VJ965_07585 [Anaerolineales bacterium]|nr:hypothetical protein [Anaerolineales bacterium]
MRRKITLVLLFSLFILMLSVQSVGAKSNQLVIPTFKITAVDEDNTVTISAVNFPTSDEFKVTMGAYGTLGIGGIVVDTQNSGTGSFSATYSIPNSLKGSSRIAIRLESPTSYYYSYNWFWNNTTSGSPGGSTTWGYPPNGAGTIPSTNVTNVTPEMDVTVKGTNFTTTDTYDVFIGKFGTKGVGGVKVATQDTDSSGKFTETYTIPASLKTEGKLAIRFVSQNAGYYAYDWFVNTGAAVTPPSGAGYPPNGANSIPTFTITAVVKDDTVTIKGTNFTTNDTYKVTMGAFGTKGVGGVEVATENTDGTGAFTATYSIPNSLKGSSSIAIRLQSPSTGYYSYNWFNNSNYP